MTLLLAQPRQLRLSLAKLKPLTGRSFNVCEAALY